MPYVGINSSIHLAGGRCPACNRPLLKTVEKVEMPSTDVQRSAIPFCPYCRKTFGPFEDQRGDRQYNERFESPDPMTVFNTPTRGDAQFDTRTQAADPTGEDMGRSQYWQLCLIVVV